MKLEESLRWDQFVIVSWAFTNHVFILRINGLKDGDTDWLSFELTVLAILKTNLVHWFILCSEVAVNNPDSLVFFGPVHDTGCQVYCISQDRELFPTALCSNHTRENVSSCDTTVAPGPFNLSELSPHVHCCKNCSLRIIGMSHWT